MKKLVICCAVFAVSGPAVWPGVVIEMQSSESKLEAGTDRIYVEGEMLRMDPHKTKDGGNMSMIFRDETLWMVDHDKKLVQTMDKDDIAQISDAMSQMQAEMAKLPPEQRAMMEKMMKDRIPAGMASAEDGAERRIEDGASEKVGAYDCTIKTMYLGDQKVWEVCAATDSVPKAATEAMAAFRAMARFAEPLREAAQQGPLAGMLDTPFHKMDEIGGFPVRVRTFANGQLTTETTLRSVADEDLDDATFSVPEGYEVTKVSDQMQRGR